MLLVVIAADEAGNVEQWPLSDLGDISLGDSPISVASNAGSNGNWRRWYVAPAEQVIETEVRPNFWHDKNNQPTIEVIDFGENVLGNIEIVPLSARTDEFVSVIFRIDVVPDPSIAVNSVSVQYVLEREGQAVGSITEDLLPGVSTLSVPFRGLGDVVTRRPVHYVFRATGQVIDTSGRIIVDSTPANFKFVVVDDVAEYIENRRSGDQQPIKELDKP